MKTSEIRSAFGKLSPSDQELAIALTVSEEAAQAAAGDTDKLFAAASDDTSDLEHLGNLMASAHWRRVETSAKTSETPPEPAAATEPKPSKAKAADSEADFLRQVYGKSVADGSMSIP